MNYTHTKNRSNKFQTATNTLKMDDNTERHDALIVLSPLYALSYKTTDFILLSSSSSINPMYPNAMDKQLQQQQEREKNTQSKLQCCNPSRHRQYYYYYHKRLLLRRRYNNNAERGN